RRALRHPSPRTHSPRPPPPTSRLFPYTTLFRSSGGSIKSKSSSEPKPRLCICKITDARLVRLISGSVNSGRLRKSSSEYRRIQRSEEHTSELQSRENLVCRLLLEKKKRQPGQAN